MIMLQIVSDIRILKTIYDKTLPGNRNNRDNTCVYEWVANTVNVVLTDAPKGRGLKLATHK